MLSVFVVISHLILTPAFAVRDYTPQEIADAFSFLGLPNTSTKGEIRKKYKKLSKQYHPDKGGSEAAMQKLNTSREVAIASLEMKNSQRAKSSKTGRQPDPSGSQAWTAEALYQRLLKRGYLHRHAHFVRLLATSECKIRIIDAISKYEIFLFHSEPMHVIRELDLREDWVRVLESVDYSGSPSLEMNRVRASQPETLHNRDIAELLKKAQELQGMFGSVEQFKKVVLMGEDQISGRIAFKKFLNNSGRPPLMVFDASEMKTLIQNASSVVLASMYSSFKEGIEELGVITPFEIARLFLERTNTLVELYFGSDLVKDQYGAERFRIELLARTPKASIEDIVALGALGSLSDGFDQAQWWDAYLDRLKAYGSPDIDSMFLAALKLGGAHDFGYALDQSLAEETSTSWEVIPESPLRAVLQKLSSETLMKILEQKQGWPNIKSALVDVYAERDEFYSVPFPRRLDPQIKQKILALRLERLKSIVPSGSSLLDRCRWLVQGQF